MFNCNIIETGLLLSDLYNIKHKTVPVIIGNVKLDDISDFHCLHLCLNEEQDTIQVVTRIFELAN